MREIVVNIHVHTRYSDGAGTHHDIARAAMRSGLDAVVVTDHNVLVKGLDGYYHAGDRRLLMIVGEELHDQARVPQKNHMLVFGTDRELAGATADPQSLIRLARELGGLSFLAHPFEQAAPLFHQPDISWVDWSVDGYTGLEIWNAYSELKAAIPTRLHALIHVFLPWLVAHGPPQAVLKHWDEQLARGRRLVAIGGSDAHGITYTMGVLRKVVFPYEFHFRGINTHVLLEQPLSGVVHEDRRAILASIRAGRCFIGYDLPSPTRGFSFRAHGRDKVVSLGEELPCKGGVTLQARVPLSAELRLVKNGSVVGRWPHRTAFTFTALEPGAYRVEAYRSYLGRRRGWIFSNPIHLI